MRNQEKTGLKNEPVFTSFGIQKLSPGFLLLLMMVNITLQDSYKDNYDVNNGCATINCKLYPNYRNITM